MKKFSLFLAVATIFATLFSSCNPDPEPENDENTIALTTTYMYSFGVIEYYLPNLRIFAGSCGSEGLSINRETAEISGSGYGIDFVLSSYVNDAGFPITTQQNQNDISFDEAFTNFNINPGECAINIWKIENGEVIDSLEIDDLEITFDKNSNWENAEYHIKATTKDESFSFTFKGKVTKEDLFFAEIQKDNIEPAKKINENITFLENEIDYNCELYLCQDKLNAISVFMLSETYLGYFMCYGSPENRSNIYGTYTIATEHNVGTASKSPGAEIYTDEDGTFLDPYPSVIAHFNEETHEEEYFLVQEGSITIEENKILFNITTQNGSEISGTYSGELDVMSEAERYDEEEDFAPQKAQRKNKFTKKDINKKHTFRSPFKK
ncbi:MAG: hypothetical protein IJY67_08110 [Paludibacteraceae bacterium]|nr:hypothetical protein [Paludibacteraceae bacterium]